MTFKIEQDLDRWTDAIKFSILFQDWEKEQDVK